MHIYLMLTPGAKCSTFFTLEFKFYWGRLGFFIENKLKIAGLLQKKKWQINISASVNRQRCAVAFIVRRETLEMMLINEKF